MRRVAVAVAWWCCVYVEHGAHAESGAKRMPFRVRYHAVEGCPDASEFVRQVLARTPLARQANSDETAHVFTVEINSEEGESLGRMQIEEPDGSSTARSFDDARCSDVVGSLALIAALTLDPDASTKPLPPAGTKSAPPKPKALPAVQQKSNQVTASSAPPTESEKPARSWQASSGVGVAFVYGLAPSVMTAAQTFVGVGARGGASARITAFITPAIEADAGPAGAKFQWLGARLDGCPFSIALDRSADLGGCAGIELGSLRATGLPGGPIHRTQSQAPTWLAAVALARLSVALVGELRIEPEAGLAVPLFRHDFVFRNPDADIYHVPWASGRVGVNLGFRFP